MSKRALQYLAMFAILSLICACASTPLVKSPEANFKDGETAYAAKKYEDAVVAWKKVKDAYSSPELTTRAELKIADAHFANKAYVEAAVAYEDFRKLHPRHEKAAYALYRLAVSDYFQITGIDTDQTPVKNAVMAMETFLRQYPGSKNPADAPLVKISPTLEGFLNDYNDAQFSTDIRLKLADCKMKQLAYENYVGSFYLRTGKYTSAIKRLNEALLRFPEEPNRDETLFHLGNAYLKAGNPKEAQAAFGRLSSEYPHSPLNKGVVKPLSGFAVHSSARG